MRLKIYDKVLVKFKSGRVKVFRNLGIYRHGRCYILSGYFLSFMRYLWRVKNFVKVISFDGRDVYISDFYRQCYIYRGRVVRFNELGGL